MLALVVAGSILPESSLPAALSRFPLSDKLQHFAAYCMLTALPALHEGKRALRAIVAGLLALIVGLEFGQVYSRGRSFEMADMLAGGCGAIAGLMLRLVAACRESGGTAAECPGRGVRDSR
jgi:VanZ family protein